MVILKNTRRRRFQFTLYHDKVCRRAGRCFCQVVMRKNDKGKRVSEHHPASVQIDGGQESDPLPNAALHVPQVKAALRPGGFLKRKDIPDAQAAARQDAAAAKAAKARAAAKKKALKTTTFGDEPAPAAAAAPAKPTKPPKKSGR
jgi:hypothetical protein